MTRVDVDFNSIGRDGLIKASPRRVDGPVSLGDTVEVYDSSEPDMSYQGTIEEIQPSGRILIRVAWEPAYCHAMVHYATLPAIVNCDQNVTSRATRRVDYLPQRRHLVPGFSR
jgi:hypothetical protein